ncbi:MAG TPA: hypothetical protein VJJ79_00810 [Candidatus Nanoarchaeia archaeon]|nr:hypothetical protein [Candidatus Nanoarchaeia archaeon]
MNVSLKNVWKNTLYRNSLFIILSSVVTGIFGFVFWTFAARNYSSQEVGLATTVISILGLLSNLSLLGFNIALLRYSKKDNGKLNFSAVFVSIVASIILAGIFVIGVQYFLPAVGFLGENLWYASAFIIFTVINSLYLISNSIFIAEGKGYLVLMKESLFSVTKVACILFLSGVTGLLVSWNAGIALGVLFSFFFIKMHIGFDLRQLKEIGGFTFYNYWGHIFNMLPTLLLPLIITPFLGPSSTAYFYISWMIANGLFIVANATSTNFLSEASKKSNQWKKKLDHALIFSGMGLLIGTGAILLFGHLILSLFSPEYLAGYTLLQVLAVSSIPYGARTLYVSFLNLRNNAREGAAVNFLVFFVTILGSVLFMEYGLIVIGISWNVANLAGLALGMVLKQLEKTH